LNALVNDSILVKTSARVKASILVMKSTQVEVSDQVEASTLVKASALIVASTLDRSTIAIAVAMKQIAKIELSSTNIIQDSHTTSDTDNSNNSLHCYKYSCLVP
jgi:hypothetical protein